MTKQDYEMLPADEQSHFMECPKCGEMFDRRQLDEVLFHMDHKPRPDIPYSGSERIS
jgi:hypothetical protein